MEMETIKTYKKVTINVGIAGGKLSEVVQRLLFSYGCRWWSGLEEIEQARTYAGQTIKIEVNEAGRLTYGAVDGEYTDINAATEFHKLIAHFEQLITKEIVLHPIKGEQNEAVVDFVNKTVVVGCHTFPFSDIEELYQVIQNKE